MIKIFISSFFLLKKFQISNKITCGKTRKGYLWVYFAPGKGVVLKWRPGRGADCLKEMLDYYQGTIQSDGYPAYPAYNKTRADNCKLTLACCWAHARRKFHEEDFSVLSARISNRFTIKEKDYLLQNISSA